MVTSLQAPEPDVLRSGIKAPVKETLLTPRFYTTDFEAMARMDISGQNSELLAILEDLRADYNQKHFVRDRQEFGLEPPFLCK